MDLRAQVPCRLTIKNGFDIFSCAAAVGSKGRMWAVAASVWAFVAAMGTVTGAAQDFSASVWDAQALNDLS